MWCVACSRSGKLWSSVGARLLLVLSLVAALGCTAIPEGRSAVDRLEVTGNDLIDDDEIEERVATRETPRFLGLFRGVIYDYQVFDVYVLQRDLQRIERYYRARGFYKARVRASRIKYTDDRHVRVTISVEEGPRTIVSALEIHGAEGLPLALERELALAAASGGTSVGAPLEEALFEASARAMQRTLTDAGYAYARVTRAAKVDLPRDAASVRFDVYPGKAAVFGEVRLHGLGQIPRRPVLTAIDIRPGTPYSTSAIDDARQALLELGVFSTARIEPELPDPPPFPRVVPLDVYVEVTPHRVLRIGGGAEADPIRSDIHLLLAWQHNNFLGNLRRFHAELSPGLVFYPTRVPTFEAPTHYLPELRLRSSLAQPGFLEARTHGTVQAEYSVYPLLVTPEAVPDTPVIGYQELRGGVGLQRSFRRFFGFPSYNLQTNVPFAYIGELDPALRQVVISYIDLFTTYDLRDDPLAPRRGLLATLDVQAAGLGGHARDVRVQPELRTYLPMGRLLTLGLRGTLGVLFPFNYGEIVETTRFGGTAAADRAAWVRDSQLLYFRAFFSGGPASNRGYPLRGVGPHGVVPFLLPRTQVDDCVPGDRRPECVFPLGGFTLWESSVELRYPLAGSFTAATFCDAGDVSSRRLTFAYNLHLSCGEGLRYATPIGPVRLDVSYRIPGLQIIDGSARRLPDYGGVLGLPVTVSLGIGEAF